MLGDEKDPLALEGEPVSAKAILEEYERGEIEIEEAEERIDKMMHIGHSMPSLREMYEDERAEEERAADRRHERLLMHRRIEEDLERQGCTHAPSADCEHDLTADPEEFVERCRQVTGKALMRHAAVGP